MSKGFNVSLHQISIGYRYFKDEPMPGNLPFQQAGCDLVREFGLDRVRAVLTAIPNETGVSDDDALAAARAADKEVSK